jgi:hypothetical protein
LAQSGTSHLAATVNTVNAVRRQILDTMSVVRFSKLDVAGSSPVSRSMFSVTYLKFSAEAEGPAGVNISARIQAS